MNWFYTKEERAAVIAGVFAIIVGALAAIGGYIGGKSDLFTLIDAHSEELKRQEKLIKEQHKQSMIAKELESWGKQAKIIHGARQALIGLATEPENDLLVIKNRIFNITEIEKQFDDVGLLKFVRDNGSKDSYERFTKLMNKRSAASLKLHVFVKRLIHTGQEMSPEEYSKKTEELIPLIQKEAESSAAYFGFSQFESLKSLSADNSANKKIQPTQ